MPAGEIQVLLAVKRLQIALKSRGARIIYLNACFLEARIIPCSAARAYEVDFEDCCIYWYAQAVYGCGYE
jgi:hypothetical protein